MQASIINNIFNIKTRWCEFFFASWIIYRTGNSLRLRKYSATSSSSWLLPLAPDRNSRLIPFCASVLNPNSNISNCPISALRLSAIRSGSPVSAASCRASCCAWIISSSDNPCWINRLLSASICPAASVACSFISFVFRGGGVLPTKSVSYTHLTLPTKA